MSTILFQSQAKCQKQAIDNAGAVLVADLAGAAPGTE
jgi:hypothetical protein